MKIIQYILVIGFPRETIASIQHLIAQGWQPFGSPTSVMSGETKREGDKLGDYPIGTNVINTYVTQAMVKYEVGSTWENTYSEKQP